MPCPCEVCLVYPGRTRFFYEDAIRFWFELRNIWSKPVYEALPLIQMNDPEYFSQLRILFDQRTSEEKLCAARLIHTKLFLKESLIY